jgi:type II secretory pathway component PulF
MTDRKPSFAVTALLVAAGALLWLGMWAQLLILTPGMRRRFDEFGLQLPALTKLLISLSDWVSDNWWLTLPAVVAAVVVCGGALGWLRHRRGWTVPVTLFTVLLIALLLAGNAAVAFSLALPEVKLQEGLAK